MMNVQTVQPRYYAGFGIGIVQSIKQNGNLIWMLNESNPVQITISA